jgi:hypothetical protein
MQLTIVPMPFSAAGGGTRLRGVTAAGSPPQAGTPMAGRWANTRRTVAPQTNLPPHTLHHLRRPARVARSASMWVGMTELHPRWAWPLIHC